MDTVLDGDEGLADTVKAVKTVCDNAWTGLVPRRQFALEVDRGNAAPLIGDIKRALVRRERQTLRRREFTWRIDPFEVGAPLFKPEHCS